MKLDRWSIAFALLLIIAAVASRLLPHPPNMTPLAAVGLFSGAYLVGRWSWLVPLIALLISDALIGWYDLPVMLSVYASFALIAWLGTRLRSNRTILRLLSTTLGASLIFFLVTNAAVWAWGHLYPLTIEGLVASYVNGLPFWRNMLVGDIAFVGLLFGAYELIKTVSRVRRIHGQSAGSH